MKIVRESKSKNGRIWQNTPQPPKMKIVRESKSESGRIPPQKMKIIRDSKSKSGRIPPKNENCQRLQIQEWQNLAEYPPNPQK